MMISGAGRAHKSSELREIAARMLIRKITQLSDRNKLGEKRIAEIKNGLSVLVAEEGLAEALKEAKNG